MKSAESVSASAGGSSIFEKLRQSRSLLMGLAIFLIAMYHAPLEIHNFWLYTFTSSLNMGVDLFLFFSGLGACHSLARRGAVSYLAQRAKRLLPGLYLFLLPWCAVMAYLGQMSLTEFLGNITFLGWWFGLHDQLNWYFSGVWLFFLLAPALYRLFCKTRHTLCLWAVLVAISFGLGLLCPNDHYMTVLTRLPIFLTGMLFGRLEQTGCKRERLLRGICYGLLPIGLYLVVITYGGYGWTYGYSLGLWWYPYALVIPGGALLVSELFALLRRYKPVRLAVKPMEWLGESSSEGLMVHIGIYKIIFVLRTFHNHIWIIIWLATMVLSVLYRQITKRLPGSA